MKKNKAMRFASILLVMTLLSTCVVSGTFAKYTTQATGNDSARVAKWGVELTVNAGNFATKYETDDTTSTDQAYSVKSTTDKVVAPGTDSTETGCQATFSIKGSPEVATKVSVVLDNVQDVCLPAGTSYTDYTEVTGYDTNGDPTYGTFTLSDDYYPVVWTLTQTASAQISSPVVLATGTLAQIKTYLDTYNNTLSMSSYAAEQSIAADFTLDWAWDFDANGAGTNDKADTYLGNVAAGLASGGNGISTNIGYDLTVTVTQVD